mmetsp:Transcript_26539/g.53309  ORF Transcript_26539/g.53309 Transcript_26539/m.53309 type:complete len:288 (-) Transcript_26539:1884-2747(-)
MFYAQSSERNLPGPHREGVGYSGKTAADGGFRDEKWLLVLVPSLFRRAACFSSSSSSGGCVVVFALVQHDHQSRGVVVSAQRERFAHQLPRDPLRAPVHRQALAHEVDHSLRPQHVPQTVGSHHHELVASLHFHSQDFGGRHQRTTATAAAASITAASSSRSSSTATKAAATPSARRAAASALLPGLEGDVAEGAGDGEDAEQAVFADVGLEAQRFDASALATTRHLVVVAQFHHFSLSRQHRSAIPHVAAHQPQTSVGTAATATSTTVNTLTVHTRRVQLRQRQRR